MELPKLDKQTMMVALIWTAFIGSSVVLLIDWKLKQDILILCSKIDPEGKASPNGNAFAVGDRDGDLPEPVVLVLYDDEESTGTRTGSPTRKTRTRTRTTDASRASENPERLPEVDVRVEGE